MSKVRVGILGYGVIGRRLADAVVLQPDMRLIGIAGRAASFSLRDAQLQGFDAYVTDTPRAGDIASRLTNVCEDFGLLLSEIDVLLDCTPSGVPREYRELLDSIEHLVTIVQGGESNEDCEASFNSMTSFSQVVGKKRIRVISCSSTGTTRFLHTIEQAFGVKQAFVTLARRAADPGKLSKVPFNSLVPTLGSSHHARDVLTVLPGLNVVSVSVNCPTTLGHVILFQVDLQRTARRDEVIEALRALPRVVVGRDIRSTADLAEQYTDQGRRRGDRPEIYVFEDSIELCGKTLMAAISVHMESITIPETIDCIRAALNTAAAPWESIALTDRSLGIYQAEALYAASAGAVSPPAF
jgi:glyceraldehyde-3-phosphate dehydrogenase (NAD(P))